MKTQTSTSSQSIHTSPHLRLVAPPPEPERPSSGRTLHLLDVENLAGDPWASDDLLAHARTVYCEVVGYRADDHSIAGCNGRLIHRASTIWMPGGLWRVGHGADGGENSILAVVDPADVSRRFDRVVIGSGDHAFTDLARALRDLGVEVWVAARPGSLARPLGRTADVVAWLRLDPPNSSAQAVEPVGPVAA